VTLVVPNAVRIPVGVLVERRPSTTPWAEWSWQATDVLEMAPELPPWTVLREAAGATLFLAGLAEVTLYPSDTANYRDNLAAAAPLVWVVLRPGAARHGLLLHAVTVDGGEAEAMADAGQDLMDALPLPRFLASAMAAFVAEHHVEREFFKRRRDRPDPGARGRRWDATEE